MNLADVMDEVAQALGAISGLNVHAWPVPRASGTTAIVAYPDGITFDETYGRGMDSLKLPVVVLCGRPTERATRDRLAAFVDGSGAKSVKAAVEAFAYTACDTVTVTGVDFDTYEVAGVPHLAAIFDLEISGQGA